MSSRPLEDLASNARETPNLFARLVPHNAHAYTSFSSVVDAILDNPDRFDYHRQFIHFDVSRVPIQSLLRRSSTPARTASDTGTDTEPDASTPDSDDQVWSGYYLLSLKIRPTLPAVGWRVGTGRWTSTDPSGSVDFLLSHNTPQNDVRGSHACFVFDKETGILMLEARNQRHGVKLDSNYFGRRDGSRALNRPSSIIQLGELQYEFTYTMQPGTALESEFQSLKIEFFRRHLNAPAPLEATSATPSQNNMMVGNWTLHSAVGMGAFGVVSAASHHNGEVVAFKQLLRHNSATAKAVAREVSSAQEIKSATAMHIHKQYIIQLKEVIYQGAQVEFHASHPEHVFILYTPLARGTFLDQILANKTDPPSLNVRIALFTQILKGLACLHSLHWVHRDIKPTNLGVVSLAPPRAIILDLGQACYFRPSGSSSGIPQQPDCCGTVHYLAPEMEKKPYTAAVDIWAAGLVAHELFFGFHPWRMSVNPWRPDRNPRMQETVATYHSRLDHLGQQPKDGIENLILNMLWWDPGLRYSPEQALGHISLQKTHEDVLQPGIHTGKKRPRE